MPGFDDKRKMSRSGFTIMELLVAMAIFGVILVLVLSVIDSASSTWRRSSQQIEAFQDGRNAFEMIIRTLSQATLNAYLDYDDPTNPTKYFRRSDLRFVSGPVGTGSLAGTPGTGQAMFFQAPVNYTRQPARFSGLEGALNACGYFVQFGSDVAEKPGFVTSPDRHRYRLMQMTGPTEANTIFSGGDGWFADHSGEARAISDNVIALVVRPQDPAASTSDLTSNYSYDTAAAFSGTQPVTSNQLPPVVAVTVILIDEQSAKRLEAGTAEPSVIRNALAGKFRDPAHYQNDLQTVEDALNSAIPPVGYRVLEMAVPIRESRWSK